MPETSQLRRADATCHEAVDTMLAHFRAGDIGGGLEAGVQHLAGVAAEAARGNPSG